MTIHTKSCILSSFQKGFYQGLPYIVVETAPPPITKEFQYLVFIYDLNWNVQNNLHVGQFIRLTVLPKIPEENIVEALHVDNIF